jgi:ketosteroid isomerase-like protein
MALKRGGTMKSVEVMSIAMKFNEKINQRDLEGLSELMTDDHAFIDSAGTITKGKAVMREGWKDFFQRFPDYQNIFTCVTVQNDIAVMVGYSSCSFKPLDGPNVWTAKADGKQISEWRVIWIDRER